LLLFEITKASTIMKKSLFAVAITALCAILFAFVSQPEKPKLEYKWFKYRTGEAGIPAPGATSAKQASNYVLVGDNPYCGGMEGYCGIFAEASDATGTVLPVLGPTEESEINAFFSDPVNYSGELVDRTYE
jgi:hypothetical protein